jgi:hypothetical protein
VPDLNDALDPSQSRSVANLGALGRFSSGSGAEERTNDSEDLARAKERPKFAHDGAAGTTDPTSGVPVTVNAVCMPAR